MKLVHSAITLKNRSSFIVCGVNFTIIVDNVHLHLEKNADFFFVSVATEYLYVLFNFLIEVLLNTYLREPSNKEIMLGKYELWNIVSYRIYKLRIEPLLKCCYIEIEG